MAEEGHRGGFTDKEGCLGLVRASEAGRAACAQFFKLRCALRGATPRRIEREGEGWSL